MGLILFALSFLTYMVTLAPSITVGDAGEFCAAGTILGLPHSPGYPLYCLLAKVMTILVPWGSLAYRINILSALCGSLTVTLLYFTFKRLAARPDPGIAPEAWWGKLLPALPALLLLVSTAFWRSSIQAEVFSLNALFAAAILFAVVSQLDYLAVFLFGLGLGNHQTLVFMAPLVVYGALKSAPLTWRRAGTFMMLFAAGWTIYVYLPIRSFKNPGLDWGNPENLRNLWRVVTRADYGSLSLTTGEKIPRTAATLMQQLLRFGSGIIQQFTIAGLLTGLLGIVYALKKKLPFSGIILLTWAAAGPGFLLLANMPFDPQSEGVLERFYILTAVLWAFPVFYGITAITGRLDRRFVAVTGAVLILAMGAARASKISWREYFLEYDYGRNILRSLRPDAVLFMDGGDDTFYSLAYLTFAEKRRPDLELHDRGGLVYRNIYGADFRRLAREEKERRRQSIERTFLGKRPIYYSTFNTQIMPGVEMAADGFLYRPRDGDRGNVWSMYSLRAVYDHEFDDYRSRALVPIYPYFEAFTDAGDRARYWKYAYLRWPDALWAKSNLKIELTNEAFKDFSAGRLDRAAELYATLAEWFPDDASFVLNLGVIEEKRGRFDAARDLYRRATEINPSSADAYYNLAVTYWREEKWAEVVQYMRRILQVNPGDERARRFLPQAEYRLNLERK